MSTGCECEYIEVKPGEWFCVLEHTDAPKNSWDWREHANAYGPFESCDAARKYMQTHPNPGGSFVQAYEEGFVPDEVLVGLIAKATL